jgi:hypothetical protein
MTRRPSLRSDPRVRAERFVRGWIVADYEPDDVDPRYMSERSVERLIERVADLLGGQSMRPPGHQRLEMGSPREAAKQHRGDEDLRSPECLAYSLCLDHSIEQGWATFSCRGCAGPGAEARHQGRQGEAPHNNTRVISTPQTNPDGTPLG